MNVIQKLSERTKDVFSNVSTVVKATSSRALVLGLSAFVIVVVATIYISRGDFLDVQLKEDAIDVVAKEISVGAPIMLLVPDDVNIFEKNDVKSVKSDEPSIVFTPAIAGKWDIEPENLPDNAIVYYPSEKLEIGSVYQVALPMDDDAELRKFFKIVAAPRLLNIFPSMDSEASVESEITLVFNRPMVPLTTLDSLDADGLVEMTPVTEGKWKWISTRTLQFQPTDGLKSASKYTLTTTEKLRSFDGILIPATSHTFTTTHLRYVGTSATEVRYNEPITIHFNQAIDVEKISKNIAVKNSTTGKKVDLVLGYHISDIWNDKTNKTESITDTSTLAIYQKVDGFGRSKFWDISTQYELELKKAYPLEGDLILDEERRVIFNSSALMNSVYSTSERSPYATPNFFDTEGALVVQFNEEIDVKKSIITSPDMASVSHPMECDETKDIEYVDGETKCEKIPVKTRLEIKFKSKSYPAKTLLPVTFSEIYNMDGQKINVKDEIITLMTPPVFSMSYILMDRERADMLYVCSTTPIHRPEYSTTSEQNTELKIEELITANFPYTFFTWDSSVMVTPENVEYYKCPIGEFSTQVSLGLEPQKQYTFTFKVKDVFGMAGELTRTVQSLPIPSSDIHLFNFQEGYTVSHPNRTKLTFGVRNLPYVKLSICKVADIDMLRLVNNGVNFDAKYAGECMWSKNQRVDVLGGYWKTNYFNIDLRKYLEGEDIRGHYVISLSHPDYVTLDYETKKYVQIYNHSLVTLTNMSVVTKEILNSEGSYMGVDEALKPEQKKNIKNLFWVTDMNTLAPIKRALIETFSTQGKNQYIGSGKLSTNENGVLQSSIYPNSVGSIVTSVDGLDSAIIARQSGMSSASDAYRMEKVYVYSDRPIYRPGDTVHIKGIYRLGYDGAYELESGKVIDLIVYNNDYNEIVKQKVTLNAFGAFTTDVVLDSGASLGSYSINAGSNAYGSQARFDVEEYAPAAFKLEATSNQEEFISGEKLEMDIQADYYFGVPLESGKVDYSIVAQDYFFDRYTDEYFSFGGSWYDCWYECTVRDSFIKSGSTEIGKDGGAKISEVLKLESAVGEALESKIYTINISVTNPNGQQISTQKSFIVHKSNVYFGLITDEYYVTVGQDVNAKVKSVDTEGKVLANVNATLGINKVNWNSSRRKEVDGGYYFNSVKELKLVKEYSVKTDANGNWSKAFQLEDVGQYELVLTYKDDSGNTSTTSYSMYVGGGNVRNQDENTLVQPNNDTTLELVNNVPLVEVGETAKLLVKNPFQGKTKALIAVERGEIFDYKIMDVDSSFFNYEFKITDKYIPNVYVSVVLLSSLDDELGGMKFGSTQYSVGTKLKQLDIQVTPDKKTYLPGEKVALKLEVKDMAGAPVESELSVAVVDMSVLALVGNPKKNPVKFFFDHFPLTVQTTANLKHLLHEINIKSGKGGGGGDGDLETMKRGVFKGTAFWLGTITTDAKGNAQTSFVLPDNLTTWQIETVGVTKSTLSGVGYTEISTQKRLSLTPLKPRFVVPGDTFKIGAKVFNQSGEKQKIAVVVSSSTLQLTSDVSQSVTLDADETKTVYFEVVAPTDVIHGSHVFELSAKADLLSDVVEQKISITENTTYETVATSHMTTDERAFEFVSIPNNVLSENGSLMINSSATLAVFLSQGLNSLLSFPYGCTEQIASKLEAIAVVKKSLNVKNIGEMFELDTIEFDGQEHTLEELMVLGIARLLENQNPDGGFTFYKGWKSNFYVTLRTLGTLTKLREAGAVVDDGVIERASEYLIQTISNEEGYTDVESLIYVSEIVAGSELTKAKISRLKDRIGSAVLRKDGVITSLNNLALASLAHTLALVPDQFTVAQADVIFAEMENRLRIDARGAYLPMSKDIEWAYFESAELNTARMLSAFVAGERKSEMLDEMLRWLLKSRAKDGAWGTTSSTLAVVSAMTDYMVWQKENEADFNLAILVDDEEISDFKFAPESESLLTQKTVDIAPLSKLPIGDMFSIEFAKTDHNARKNNYYYDIALKYFLSADQIFARDEGFAISRGLYTREDVEMTTPLTSANVGDILRGSITFIVPQESHYVAIENYIPAGTELVNMDLATENQSLDYVDEDLPFENGEAVVQSDTMEFIPEKEELRDDRLFLFNQYVAPGVYEYEYYIRVLIPGEYTYLPAHISEMYTPENFGRTDGSIFTVVSPAL